MLIGRHCQYPARVGAANPRLNHWYVDYACNHRAKKKEITDSFCEEDTQENVKGTRGAGESLSNYSVPFVNLSGLFGK